MSTQDQLNNNFYGYVIYYLYQSGGAALPIQFSLEDNGAGPFISYWGYTTIAQPTNAQLLTYTQAQVNAYATNIQLINQISATAPTSITSGQLSALSTIGGIPEGSIVWVSDTSSLQYFSGGIWKTLY